jgi:uncharacterized membrane protein
VTAYSASAVISAGPWLTAVLALTVLNLVSASFLNQVERELFFITITYAFGASLIATGALQMLVTRYLADRIYSEDTAAIAPACAGVLLLALPLALLTIPFATLAPFDLRYRLITASLFVTLSLIWMMMIFLSAARDYRRLVLVFLLAYTVGIFGAIALGQRYGLLGMLGGFTLGQVACLTLLVEQVFDEFGAVQRPQLTFLTYGRQYWDLALLGLCYNVAIWVDNAVYWFSPLGETIGGFYRSYPPYDATKMLAHLATIPASAVFLVQLETHFYRHYRTYYRLIAQKGTLQQIADARQGMIRAARAGFVTILKLQLAISGGIILFASEIAPAVGLTAAQVPILRVVVVAASCQFFMLTAMLLLLYVDQRRAALAVVAFFAISNAALSIAGVASGVQPEGIGYLLATVLAAVLSLVTLADRLQRLEYLTFSSQGMVADEPRPARGLPTLTRRLKLTFAAVAVLVLLGVVALWQRWPSAVVMAVAPPVTAPASGLASESTPPALAPPVIVSSTSTVVPVATDVPVIVATSTAPGGTVTGRIAATASPQLDAAALLGLAQSAEADLRTGELEAAIDYGDGTRSTVRIRFDLGDQRVSPRLHSVSIFQGRTGTQTVEQIAIGNLTWRKQGSGPWQVAASQEGLWEQFRGYLPHTTSATMATVAQEADGTTLRYVDSSASGNAQLVLDPTSGRPFALRRTIPANGLALIVTYAGLNTPITIAPPAVR